VGEEGVSRGSNKTLCLREILRGGWNLIEGKKSSKGLWKLRKNTCNRVCDWNTGVVGKAPSGRKRFVFKRPPPKVIAHWVVMSLSSNWGGFQKES